MILENSEAGASARPSAQTTAPAALSPDTTRGEAAGARRRRCGPPAPPPRPRAQVVAAQHPPPGAALDHGPPAVAERGELRPRLRREAQQGRRRRASAPLWEAATSSPPSGVAAACRSGRPPPGRPAPLRFSPPPMRRSSPERQARCPSGQWSAICWCSSPCQAPASSSRRPASSTARRGGQLLQPGRRGPGAGEVGADEAVRAHRRDLPAAARAWAWPPRRGGRRAGLERASALEVVRPCRQEHEARGTPPAAVTREPRRSGVVRAAWAGDVLGQLDGRTVIPEPLQGVVLAVLGELDVDDDVGEVQQHPAGIVHALAADDVGAELVGARPRRRRPRRAPAGRWRRRPGRTRP